jgi:hypothetical protein
LYQQGEGKKRYEFGNKVSVITSNRRSWILNVENCPANPYDGHTLNKTARDAEKITGVIVEEVSLDIRFPGGRLAYFCQLIAAFHQLAAEIETNIQICVKRNLTFLIKNGKKRKPQSELKVP